MSVRNLSIAAGFALAAIVPIFAQNSAPPTFAEALRKHHVGLTRTALLDALRNPNAEVRGLAAAKLAEDKAEGAVPAIAQALAAEGVPGTKVNIAFALAQLGSETGSSTLKKLCYEAQINQDLRLRAALYMLDLNSNACLSAVLQLLQSPDADDYKTAALSLVPRFKNVSREESQKILASTRKALRDKIPAVRMSASDALAQLGDAMAIPFLQNAIAAERDEVVREHVENALRRLQRKE